MSEEIDSDTHDHEITVAPANLASSEYEKIELVWPGKDIVGKVSQLPDSQWQLHTNIETQHFFPLVNIKYYPREHSPAQSMIITGDRLDALHMLARSSARTVRLAYVDSPRIGIDEATAAFRGDNLIYSSWLCVMRAHLLAIEPLLRRDGVLVFHVGETEAGLARLLADEIFRGQHVGTIVWQRAYAPRNMRGMREFTATHDILLVYAKDRASLPPVGLRRAPSGYSNQDGDPRGPWKAEHKGAKSRRAKSDFDTFVPPYRWRIVEGALPDGIWRLAPLTGVIWGVPRQAGNFPITVEITDAAGTSATKKLVLKVLPHGSPVPAPEIPWLFKEIETSGRLRVENAELPNAILGQEFSAICLGAGGKPFTDEPKRPGSGRYWEFAIETLIRAYQQDSVYLGKDKPTAIPHPKSYAPADGELVVENQQTWWPGRVANGSQTSAFTGFTEDATKHLKALKELNLIGAETSSAKPEHLIARLVDIFTDPNDVVLEPFGASGDLSAVAIKKQRRFVYLPGASERDSDLLQKCSLPRLKAVIDGQDNDIENRASEIRMRADAYLPYEGGGTFAIAQLGEWLAQRNVRDELPFLNWKAYSDPAALRSALLTMEGFIPTAASAESGIAFHDLNSAAVVIAADEFLTMELASEWVSRLSTAHKKITLYYFRSSADFRAAELPPGVNAKRVPFELGL